MKSKLSAILVCCLIVLPGVLAVPPQAKGASGSLKIFSPTVSPDGQSLAYVQEKANDREIYIVDLSSKATQNISNNRGVGRGRMDDLEPAWSPDSTRIVYSTNRNGSYDLAMYDLNSKETKILTSNMPSDDFNARWSPDGQKIAFCSYRTAHRQVYIYEFESTAEGVTKPLTKYMNPSLATTKQIATRESCYPSWSPDGASMVFWADQDIHKLDFKDGNVENLTIKLIGSWWINDSMPLWAPDGMRIAFTGRYQGFSSELYTLQPDGEKIKRLTDNFFEDIDLYWSPDGKQVAFASYAPANVYEFVIPEEKKGDSNTFVTYSPPGRLEIFTVTSEGRERKRLTNNQYHDKSPVFTRDGQKILFVRQKGATDMLYSMNLDGSDQQPFFP